MVNTVSYMSKKRIVLLGASGSIGSQTLDVIRKHSDQFELVAFSVGKRVEKVADIIDEFKVNTVCVGNSCELVNLQKAYPNVTFTYGDHGLIELANLSNYDTLVNALVGYVGLKPTMAALDHAKEIALANKETLVVGGELVMRKAKENGIPIVPIDSEHSAIFQCLQGNRKSDVKKLWITASGGAFRNLNRDQLANVTASDALKHPNWAMGDKITIDSATMVNKGFEVLEAHWLFDIDLDNIAAIMHPQSIVHSMVEYVDGAFMAQLGVADMRLPIQYALTYPNRYNCPNHQTLDFSQAMSLNFKPLDTQRFPLFKLAIDMGKKGNIFPCVFNAANEVVNKAYRDGLINYYQLEEMIHTVCDRAQGVQCVTLDTLQSSNDWAVDMATQLINRENKC